MGRVRVGVLGTTCVTLDGKPVHLTPATALLLLRLVAAEGEAVLSGQLYLDLWGRPPAGPVGSRHRNEVQKRVVELRQKLEPGVPAGASRLLVTERVLSAGHAQSAYRLVLGQDEADYLQFTDLVNRAAHAPPATAVALLKRALEDVWRGRPLADAAGQDYPARLAARLTVLHRTALEELARNLAELGQLEEALRHAGELAGQLPDDERPARLLASLRARAREEQAGDVLLRRQFPGLGAEVVVRRGDLFAQADANLAVGFGDTFDTDTDDDLIISRESAQGRLLAQVYGGDRKRLDEQLAKALRGVTPVRVETQQAKPRGKRRRFAVGTVAPLPLNGRRVFAVVHCRQDLDLVTHSSAPELRLALEQLWRSVRQHGMLKPVAMPLMGSGLSRVTELTKEELLIMIIDTFVKGCRDARCAPELRVVLWPSEVDQVRLLEVARFVEALDHNGQEPR